MRLAINIFTATLNYQKIDNHSLDNLDSAQLANNKQALQHFQEELGLEIDSITITSLNSAPTDGRLLT